PPSAPHPAVCLITGPPPTPTPFPYTTLFRSRAPPRSNSRGANDPRPPLRGADGALAPREPPARARRARRGWPALRLDRRRRTAEDRKSTRLNSSHGSISYAVFCLKQKKRPTD